MPTPIRTHEAIRRTFHLSNDRGPLPWGSGMRYGRDLFPVLFAELEFFEGAEIGVRMAGYSEMFCQANPRLHMNCIDPWAAYSKYPQERQDSYYKAACERMAQYDSTVIRKTSMEAVKEFENSSLDFVYIDGHHGFDWVMQDIIHWVPKVKRGGIVALHDYHHGRGVDVVFAVDAYTRAHHIDPWYVTKERQPTAYWVIE